MRYSKDHKTETRRRIVQNASRRFRDEGVEAVGVASLMSGVGLTVGGFYAHFESKEALIAEACSAGFAETTARFRAYLDTRPKGKRMAALIDAYLSPSHRDNAAEGCMIAANGAELGRHPQATRAAFTAQVNAWLGLIDETLRFEEVTADARGVASALVGALVLARSVDDHVLSDAFLDSGKRAVRACLTPPAKGEKK
jgi:TetR/AcrR family transcriptional regulator, transcriptional repressor for nem operon